MKPAVAKVVNPLGTVVNVHSDDDTDVEICEDIVIHENCDEALFRPMVVPKVLPHHERTKRYGDHIITKSLESTTEVAVKILKKNSNATSPKSQFHELPLHKSKGKEKETSKVEKSKNSSATEQSNAPKPTKPKSKSESKVKIDISDPFIDMPDFKPVTESKSLKEAAKIPIPEPLKEINTTLDSGSKDFNFEVQPLDNEDFFSLENISKVDDFEDVGEREESLMSTSSKTKSKSKSKSSKETFQCFDDSSTNTSEDTAEEKPLPKKTRKPKAKLGVKIANISKENSKTEKSMDCSAEITLPAPTKKSWSSVAASKPVAEQLFIDSAAKESDLNLDLPKIEFVEEFTLHLPKKSHAPSVVTDLIDINTPQEEKADREGSNEDIEEVICGSTDLLKIDKSSDDEKGDTSSSPPEITESDDSGKNATIEAVFEELLDSSTVVPTSKSSRRKKRKK